jgi:O-antigen ligase
LSAALHALAPAAARAALPLPAWSLWILWSGHLLLAGLAAQLPVRLVGAALAAGLGGTVLLALGQWGWTLPALAAEVGRGGISDPLGALGERIAHGGLYGPFVTANHLGIYLVLTALPLGVAAWCATGRGRWVLLALTALAALAALGTASKGAAVCLAVAGGIAWMALRRDRWRWLPLALAAVAALAFTLAPVREAFAGSAGARAGYWRAAVLLIAERPASGHGLGAYAEQHAGLMQPGDEPARHCHNEVLEAAVSGGLGAGVAVLALIALLAWPRRRTLADAPTPGTRGVVAAVAAGGVVLIALGGFAHDGGTGWWPGAGSGLAPLWALAVVAAMAAIAAVALRLPPPPGWAVGVAVGAAALHLCTDFDGHVGGLAGTLAVVAALGAPRVVSLRCMPLLAAVAAASLAISLTLMQGRVLPARQAAAELAQARSDPHRWAGLLRDVAPQTDALLAVAGTDPDLQVRLLELLAPGRARTPFTAMLAARLPHRASLRSMQAQDAWLMGDHAAALDHARAAVALAPTALPLRRQLLNLLRRRLTAQPELAAEIAAVSAELDRLTPLVHRSDR